MMTCVIELQFILDRLTHLQMYDQIALYFVCLSHQIQYLADSALQWYEESVCANIERVRERESRQYNNWVNFASK